MHTWTLRTWEPSRLCLYDALGLFNPAGRGFLGQVHRGVLAHGQGRVCADHQDTQANPEHQLDKTKTQGSKGSGGLCSPAPHRGGRGRRAQRGRRGPAGLPAPMLAARRWRSLTSQRDRLIGPTCQSQAGPGGRGRLSAERGPPRPLARPPGVQGLDLPTPVAAEVGLPDGSAQKRKNLRAGPSPKGALRPPACHPTAVQRAQGAVGLPPMSSRTGHAWSHRHRGGGSSPPPLSSGYPVRLPNESARAAHAAARRGSSPLSLSLP